MVMATSYSKKKLGLAVCAVTALAAVLVAQPKAADPVLVNSGTAKWVHEKNDAPGSESVVLREDAQTGGLELLVRYPAGHVFSPHWHSSNERMILLEGRMSVEVGQTKTSLEPGGYAFLPAKQTQRLACTSQTRCAFYLYWDGKLDFNSTK